MSDRVDFYFRQRVTEAELDLAFSLLEKADRDLASDLNIYGVVSGALPTEHAPVPNLTVDLTAPCRAYDNLGQRIVFGTGQTVDCAVDLVGIPTDVATSGSERWVGIFLRFKRLLSDPRTDGNSQQVFFRRDESYELVVRQAPEGRLGAAPKPALEPDELLLDPSTWTILRPVANNVQASLDQVDGELRNHFGGSARRHAAGVITSEALVGRPNALAQGSVRDHLAALLGILNQHIVDSPSTWPADAIVFADNGQRYNATHVEDALGEIALTFGCDHFASNVPNAGMHSVIRQPAFTGPRALLWDAEGVGGASGRLRVYADGDAVWFVLNAAWRDKAWWRDLTGAASTGFRLSNDAFEFLYDGAAVNNFADWARKWRLPMSSATNSAFETEGAIQETGRIGLWVENANAAARTATVGQTVSFRSRLPVTPGIISLTTLESRSWSAEPSVFSADRDGISITATVTVSANSFAYWIGRYTVTA